MAENISWAYALAIAQDGHLYVGGGGYSGGPPYKPWMYKFTNGLVLDTAFGSSGIVQISAEEGKIAGIALDSSGKIYPSGFLGSLMGDGVGDLFVAKYTSAGTLDSTFGSAGVMLKSDAIYSPSASVMLPNDLLIVVGKTIAEDETETAKLFAVDPTAGDLATAYFTSGTYSFGIGHAATAISDNYGRSVVVGLECTAIAICDTRVTRFR